MYKFQYYFFNIPSFRKYRTKNGREPNVMLIRTGANTL